ncbi:MAG TPA: hypothetical protein VII64_05340 [Thermodesulfobacteriota bacterium]
MRPDLVPSAAAALAFGMRGCRHPGGFSMAIAPGGIHAIEESLKGVVPA